MRSRRSRSRMSEAFAQESDIERGEAFATRTGSDVGKSFGVSAEGDGELIGEVRTIGNARFEESANVAADLFGLGGTDDAGNAERGHQAKGADGKVGALQNGMVEKNIDFEPGSPKIG